MPRILIMLSLLALTGPRLAWGVGGILDVTIVSDPQGLIQQVASVGQEIKMNAALAQEYEQLLKQYVQDAKAYVSLPMDVLQDVQSTIQQYYDVLQQGQQLSFSITSAVQQFDQLYSSGFNGQTSLFAKAQQYAGVLRNMGRVATQTQALYERLCQQKAKTDRLLTASMAAPGTLSALQAQAQLTGVLIEQQGALQEIAATSGRMQTAWIMQQAVAEEQAASQSQQWIGTLTPQPFRAPGQGQGPELPH